MLLVWMGGVLIRLRLAANEPGRPQFEHACVRHLHGAPLARRACAPKEAPLTIKDRRFPLQTEIGCDGF